MSSMLSKIIASVTFCTLPLTLMGQQLPPFNLYRSYLDMINPAAVYSEYLQTETKHNKSIVVSYRHEGQRGWKEAPHTPLANFRCLPRINKIGGFQLFGGGAIFQDQFGPEQSTGALLRFGSLNYTNNGLWSAGFNAGIVWYEIKPTDEQGLFPGDPVLAQGQVQHLPYLGLGVFFSQKFDVKHSVYFGLSIPQVFDLDRRGSTLDEDYPLVLSPHIYGLAGMRMNTSESGFWEPSIWIKYFPQNDLQVYNRNKVHADFNLRHRFYQPLWLGAGISTLGTFHTEFGIDFNKMDGNNNVVKEDYFLQIGIGYDFNINPLSARFNQAFEINLTYFFMK